MTQDVQQLEREVERARERLLANLSLLSSPVAVAEFKANVREEARDTLRNVVRDVKGRVAANPAAALAIGAGVAWRLLRDPPIATTLIGAGLFSLWRTNPVITPDDDYLGAAQARLGEQVESFAGSVGAKAAQVASEVKGRVDDMAEAAKEALGQTADDLAARAAAASHKVASAAEDAAGAVRAIPATVGRTIAEPETRDTLLLGAAGLAVAAALGIAYQRRATEQRDRAAS